MLSIALPKGSLEEGTFQLFKEADLEIISTERGYSPKIKDPRIGKVKILRPQEIPTYVEEGHFDLGISGLDWVIESGVDVVDVASLPYSKQSSGSVKIVLAVPNDSPWNAAKDVPSGARISTEYPNLTKSYFEDMGIDVNIMFSYGATEEKVPELVDAVVDLTETGATLQRNGLKIIGILLESTTRLIANKSSWDDLTKRSEIKDIQLLLCSAI